MRFVFALVGQKIAEYLIGIGLTAIVIAVQPEPPLVFSEIKLPGDAVRNAFAIWNMLYLFTLYPFVASGVVWLADARASWSNRTLSLIGAAFSLAYTVLWLALLGALTLPWTFWCAWMLMGGVVFLTYLPLLPLARRPQKKLG